MSQATGVVPGAEQARFHAIGAHRLPRQRGAETRDKSCQQRATIGDLGQYARKLIEPLLLHHPDQPPALVAIRIEGVGSLLDLDVVHDAVEIGVGQRGRGQISIAAECLDPVRDRVAVGVDEERARAEDVDLQLIREPITVRIGARSRIA